jgi:two-component sensor histidine kinase
MRCEGVPRLNDAQEFLGYTGCGVDITDISVAEQHQRLLIHELNHRVKNTLATVQAMATQTMRNTATPRPVQEALTSRLIALAKAHDILTRQSWDGADITDVVMDVLGVHAGGERRPPIDVAGPQLRLEPRLALALSMALHELATNATKYGALSSEGGRVSVTWSLARQPGGRSLLRLAWRERGGPPVRPPAHKGFGSRLLERTLTSDLAGDVEIRYEPSGLVCTVAVPYEAGFAAEAAG